MIIENVEIKLENKSFTPFVEVVLSEMNCEDTKVFMDRLEEVKHKGIKTITRKIGKDEKIVLEITNKNKQLLNELKETTQKLKDDEYNVSIVESNNFVEFVPKRFA